MSVEDPAPPQDLSGIVGHRFVYTYATGWQYEMYVKNSTTIDYRIHSGMVAGGGSRTKRSTSCSSTSRATRSGGPSPPAPASW